MHTHGKASEFLGSFSCFSLFLSMHYQDACSFGNVSSISHLFLYVNEEIQAAECSLN